MEDVKSYDRIIKKLRAFFSDKKGFIEVPAQSRVSILAACEDPSTVTSFNIGENIWPLPQTGQMWLEHELLKKPDLKGVFCITTSYRDEKNPIPGRHDRVFPMFEFESVGDFEDLKKLMKELLIYLGFEGFSGVQYEEMCEKYNVDILEAEHEGKIAEDFGSVVLLEKFPLRTDPFWNMKHAGEMIFNKLDILIHGMETIGSAERSCSVREMRQNFKSISEGEYSQLLFDSFGEERVLKELDNYFLHDMVPRYGGGIGVTRLVRVMNKENLL
jgi:aspartyl/asparaginyl-tRNA synthetase